MKKIVYRMRRRLAEERTRTSFILQKKNIKLGIKGEKFSFVASSYEAHRMFVNSIIEKGD